MMQQYMKEMEQDPYDPDEFVERLAYRVFGNSADCDNILVDEVQETFVQAIKDLKFLQERQKKKCEKLERVCRDKESLYFGQIQSLQEQNKAGIIAFQNLDERINYVATKVIHVGDQLESINTPRSRAVQVHKLIGYLSEFMSAGPLSVDIFNDPTKVDEAADVIQKLFPIAQELPPGRYEEAKMKIAKKYDEIERLLIEEFIRHHSRKNLTRMKEVASILTHFKGYSQCVDAFIEYSQANSLSGKNLFADIVPVCEENLQIIAEVFSNPDQVMAKFVLNIYQLKLQNHIATVLSEEKGTASFLEKLSQLHKKTSILSKNLSHFNLGNDDMFLNKLQHNIFQKYLDSYFSSEIKNLKDKCLTMLQKFYESKGHQKKQIQAGGFQELRRDLQTVISTRANFNIMRIENYGGETFLSEDVAALLLQEFNHALDRCCTLSPSSDIPSNCFQIFEVLTTYLIEEYVDYGLELAIQSVPIPEAKTHDPPNVYFFDVAKQVNTIIILLEKQFSDILVPLIITTPKYSQCNSLKKKQLEQTESKIDFGLDRSLNAITGWIKICLATEQKKTDFRPETDIDTMTSVACKCVVQYLNSNIKHIRQCLDVKNADLVLAELGVRFHRVIYEHLLQYTYNSAGAMCAICDVNEYRKCVKDLGSPLVINLFDTLHALCNLLLVKHENLKQVCYGDTLVGLDYSILSNFIQLRSDFKSQKLSALLKNLTSR
ncbi:exocyst complex component 5 [Adelges cooleyi]|uniref:exocyst complex component 5 n=1 Tax=Adelges cooleyi TaxID=133065 RepID=UPI00217F50FE|nr:exocyst complex component 5 [Adelges cooleyi]